MSRSLTSAELAIASHLLRLAEADTPQRLQELQQAQVTEMDDGGMGSLQFAIDDTDDKRQFGGVLSEAVARDVDNMEVFYALILDQHDRLYELDVWKVDSSPVSRLPLPQDLKPVTQP